jgi:hypothetical protein
VRIMDRIKCPNCGSTAQVELVWDENSHYSIKQTKEYVCGCGCEFEVEFKAIKIKINA